MSNELNKIMSKCDELESKDYNNGMTAYELMEENGLVNTAKAVKEVIAELKAKIQLDDDEMAGFLDLEEECGGGDLRNYIAELKAEIKRKEAVGQRWFACCMEARTENVRLKRALWIARAKRAEARKNYWHVRCCHEGDKNLWSIDGSPVKYIGCIKRTNFDWLKVWSEVEIKCLKKAEQYKYIVSYD